MALYCITLSAGYINTHSSYFKQIVFVSVLLKQVHTVSSGSCSKFVYLVRDISVFLCGFNIETCNANKVPLSVLFSNMTCS